MNAIFVTVRTGSKRLPLKCLREVGGKPSIDWVINSAKKSRLTENIVLCTTTLPEDLVLYDIAKFHGINCYRGSAEDKLVRWRDAARQYNVDFFVCADGDDLFCSHELFDLAFEQYELNGADFIEGKNIPCGAFTYGIKVEALEKVCEIKDSENTEMMFPYFTETGMFKVEELQNVPIELQRPEFRMTLDYEDDLNFFKRVVSNFTGNFTLKDIIEFLDMNPGVVKINSYLQERWAENQKVKTHMVLKSEPIQVSR